MCFHGPARAAAHEIWCIYYSTILYHSLLLLQYNYNDVRPLDEAAHGLSRAETRAGRVQLVLKREEKRSTVTLKYFPDSEIPKMPSAYQVKVGTTMRYYCCSFWKR